MNAYIVRVAASESADILNSSDSVRKSIERANREPDLKLDLDEAWAALHFMLSGEVPIPKPEAVRRGISWNDDSFENVIMGGETTPYRASFGPARYLRPEVVKRLSQKLSNLSVEAFLERYEAEVLNSEQIPPGGWDDGAETRERLSRHFSKLVEFYKSASSSGVGLIIYMV